MEVKRQIPNCRNQFEQVRFDIRWLICIKVWTGRYEVSEDSCIVSLQILLDNNPKPWMVCILMILHTFFFDVRSEEAQAIAGDRFKPVGFIITWFICIREWTRSEKYSGTYGIVFWIICILMILRTLFSDVRSEKAQPIASNQFKPVRITTMWFICIREWTRVRSTQALMELYPYTSLCLLTLHLE